MSTSNTYHIILKQQGLEHYIKICRITIARILKFLKSTKNGEVIKVANLKMSLRKYL